MSRHVAIFTFPIPALVHPTFSMVATLIRRGYRVTYVTSERFAAEAASLGAEVVRCPRLDYPFNQDDSAAMPIEQQYVRDPISLAYRTFSVAWPFYQKHEPDLVIYDSQSFAGILVADKSGSPAIRMSNQFAYNDETLSSPAIPAVWKEKQLSVEQQANEFFDSYDSSRSNVIRSSPDETFYLYLRELQLSATAREGNALYAARCTAERPNIVRWRRPEAWRHGPTVLVAASTTYGQRPDYYKSCLSALSRLGWKTFVIVGGSSALAELDALPPNCLPVQDIPLAAVMPHADLLICAAGMATAMEASYHGLPMLMITNGHAEMEAYANRYQDFGMGVHLNRSDASPEQVAQCAGRMFADSALRQSVIRMRDAVRSSAGPEELVNWIESKTRSRL